MEQNPKKSPLILRILYGIEDALLVGILLVMIILAFAQIILRNFAGTGFVWGDAMLRIMVLWIGMVGAMIATREDNHISVDILTPLLSAHAKKIVRIFTDIFTSIVCGLLTYASIIFLIDEYSGGGVAFGDIPSWVAESILPVAFVTISLRYFIYFIRHIVQVIRKPAERASGGGAA